jgi:uncharacterized membrane protein YkoI
MKPRPALLLAAGITAFLLVIVGSVIATLSSSTSTTDAEGGARSAELQATFEQREQEYQRQLDHARSQIEETNQRLLAVYRDLTSVAAGVDVPPLSSVEVPTFEETLPPLLDDPPIGDEQPPAGEQALISSEQALQAAVAYRGGGSVERVELEEEHGLLIFDVRFVDDSRVYVDAFTGEVVYARLESAGDNSGSGGGDDSHDDHSGKGGGGDDDN